VRRGRGDRDVRGSVEPAPWEDNAHARDPPPATERTRGSKSVGARPAEADLGGVKRLVPRSSRADPKIREAPTLRKWRSDPGTHGVRVHAVYVRVAEVGRTHFASCPPLGRKAPWWNQQGASQKEARSTV
jgi:hypothetical protein